MRDNARMSQRAAEYPMQIQNTADYAAHGVACENGQAWGGIRKEGPAYSRVRKEELARRSVGE